MLQLYAYKYIYIHRASRCCRSCSWSSSWCSGRGSFCFCSSRSASFCCCSRARSCCNSSSFCCSCCSSASICCCICCSCASFCCCSSASFCCCSCCSCASSCCCWTAALPTTVPDTRAQQRLLRQYLYFCTSKARTLSTGHTVAAPAPPRRTGPR